MAIELVRIDDRLIHGQVLTTWVKQLNIEQILIINDEISKDKIQLNIFKATAPDNINLRVFSVDKFIQIFNRQQIKRRTLILLTNTIDACRLMEGGVKIPYLNIGGMKFNDNRKQYTKAVSLSEEERESLDKINDNGIEIFVQMVPSDRKITYNELINKGE